MRGFWLGPWMRNESGDPQRVLSEIMALLADGTIVPEAGALLASAAQLSAQAPQKLCCRAALRAVAAEFCFACLQVKSSPSRTHGVTGSGRKGKHFLEG